MLSGDKIHETFFIEKLEQDVQLISADPHSIKLNKSTVVWMFLDRIYLIQNSHSTHEVKRPRHEDKLRLFVMDASKSFQNEKS